MTPSPMLFVNGSGGLAHAFLGEVGEKDEGASGLNILERKAGGVGFCLRQVWIFRRKRILRVKHVGVLRFRVGGASNRDLTISSGSNHIGHVLENGKRFVTERLQTGNKKLIMKEHNV